MGTNPLYRHTSAKQQTPHPAKVWGFLPFLQHCGCTVAYQRTGFGSQLTDKNLIYWNLQSLPTANTH